MVKKILFLFLTLVFSYIVFADISSGSSHTGFSINLTSAVCDTAAELLSDNSEVRLKSNLFNENNKFSVKIDTGVGTGTSDRAGQSHIQLNANGTYRMYYQYNNGSYSQISYRDTIDTEFPTRITTSGGNISTTKNDLGVGGVGDNAGTPHIKQKPNGMYRLYYSHGSSGQLAYRDTTNTNLPDNTNLGSQVNMGIGGGANSQAYSPHIQQKPDNTYRLYYEYYNGTWYNISYQDTTNTNLPDETNLGSKVDTGVGGTSDNAFYPFVYRNTDNTYKLYYTFYDTNGYISYRTTTNTSLPDNTNLGSRVNLALDNYTFYGDLQKLLSGKWRLYYTYHDGFYPRLSYRDMSDNWDTSSPTTTFGKIGGGSAGQKWLWDGSNLFIPENTLHPNGNAPNYQYALFDLDNESDLSWNGSWLSQANLKTGIGTTTQKRWLKIKVRFTSAGTGGGSVRQGYIPAGVVGSSGGGRYAY